MVLTSVLEEKYCSKKRMDEHFVLGQDRTDKKRMEGPNETLRTDGSSL